MNARSSQVLENEWVEFPGGELEGQRPRALCPACRERLKNASLEGRILSGDAPSCFHCYRTELDRRQAEGESLRSSPRHSEAVPAGGAPRERSNVDRWQWLLPFEPVNHARLEALRADRAAARAAMQSGPGRFADKRRHAQIAARHALQRIVAGLSERDAAHRAHILADATHAAELQLPEAWLPFVVAR